MPPNGELICLAALFKLFLVFLFNLVPLEEFLGVFYESALVKRGQALEIFKKQLAVVTVALEISHFAYKFV